jgi:predicted ATPase
MALGVNLDGGNTLDVLADFLHDRDVLLILDNCEHLIQACAEVCETLLRACPAVRILATSREGLNIPGEVIWHVPSLASDEAVQLFGERAYIAARDFLLNEHNALDVAHICQRLDGIPLAIELAASRLRSLSVHQIAERLNNRFDLLTGGSRTALPRHQTLRAMVDWSYDLLTETERVLLRRLSIFAGGWTLELAEAVCGNDMIGSLMSLGDKSLVMPVRRDGDVRYHLLETIRQYGLEKLAAHGELDTLRCRHAEACLAMAQETIDHLNEKGSNVWLERLGREQDNLRAALTWSFGPDGDPVIGARLVAALWLFWENLTEYTGESRHWIEQAMQVPAEALLPATRAYVLLAYTPMKPLPADEDLTYTEEALRLFRDAGDQAGTALALTCLGLHVSRAGDHPRGEHLIEEGIALARKINMKWIVAQGMVFLTHSASFQDDYERVAAVANECLAQYRELDNTTGVGVMLFILGRAALSLLDFERAKMMAEQSLALVLSTSDHDAELRARNLMAQVVRLQGDAGRAVELSEEYLACARTYDWLGVGVTMAYFHLGMAVNMTGDHQRARALLAQCLQMRMSKYGPYPALVVSPIEALASIAASANEGTRATRLFGACEALREKESLKLPPEEAYEYAPCLSMIRVQLGVDTFAAAWAEGRTMTLEQAVAYALQGVEADVPPVR